MMKRYLLVATCLLVGGRLYAAPTLPTVSFIRAVIGDSAKQVRERAFDVLLRDAVQSTRCLNYVDMARRDSLAHAAATANHPYTFQDMEHDCDVRYGVFFALERYGYLVRLSTRVVNGGGTVFERSDLDLLQAVDTLEYRSAFEGAMRRMLARVANALALAADSTCNVRVYPQYPLLVAGTILHKMPRGFGMFLSDNTGSVCNLVLAHISDSLRIDHRFIVIDVLSRDRLFNKLGEYDIQNTSSPDAAEIALMHGAGIPLYLVAEIDSADDYRKLHLRVSAFATSASTRMPLIVRDSVIEPDLDNMYRTLQGLGYDAAETAAEALKE